MPSEIEATSPEPEGLQFDHAEFEDGSTASSVACSACQQPVPDQYFEINGAIVCGSCRDLIEGHLRGGSGFVRLLRAIVFGSAAAALGTAIYVGFLSISPLDIAIVAILVGWMVGKMVNVGSRGRGGFVYQILAMFLTYSSLALTYLIVALIQVGLPQAPAPQVPPAAAIQADAKQAEVKKAEPGAQPVDAVAAGKVPLAQLAVILLVAIGLVYAVPIMMIQGSPIMIAFVGFALWEAWKFNRKLKLVVTGPYLVGDSEPMGGVPGHA